MATKLSAQYLEGFVKPQECEAMAPQVKLAHEALHAGTGLGNDFLGWIKLPTDYDKEEFSRIQKAAKKIQSDTDVFIVIGIGGSYLGARAAIEFLKSPNYNALKKDTPDIYFAGNSISSTALAELIDLCEGKEVRNHHGACDRIPGFPGTAGEKIRQARRQGKNLLHDRQGEGHFEEAGR